MISKGAIVPHLEMTWDIYTIIKNKKLNQRLVCQLIDIIIFCGIASIYIFFGNFFIYLSIIINWKGIILFFEWKFSINKVNIFVSIVSSLVQMSCRLCIMIIKWSVYMCIQLVVTSVLDGYWLVLNSYASFNWNGTYGPKINRNRMSFYDQVHVQSWWTNIANHQIVEIIYSVNIDILN